MLGLEIKGYRQGSLIEWPGLIVDSIFLAGCDFRCPYCHNPELIHVDTIKSYNVNDILEELDKRIKSKWLDGVSITGGEPTLSEGLPKFLRILKKMKLKTKIDSNGAHPEVIDKLLNEKLLDYIAMDVKAIPEKYHLAIKVKVPMNKIKESINLIINSKIDHEFRTTVTPTIVDPENDLPIIAQMIKGAKRFFIQQFRQLKCFDKEFEKLEPYPLDRLEKMCEKLKEQFEVCQVR